MLKIINVILISFIILLFISCDNKENNINEIQSNYTDSINVERIKYRNMASKAIRTGDEKLYCRSSNWYSISRIPGSFIYFSNAMAIKYNYARAFYDTYEIYSIYFHINKENEEHFNNYLLFNLAKASELGYIIKEKEIVGEDTITADNIKSSQYYLKRSFAE